MLLPRERTMVCAATRFHRDPLELATWLATAGLLRKAEPCPACSGTLELRLEEGFRLSRQVRGSNPNIHKKAPARDGVYFCCPKCLTTRSIRVGTIFAKSSVSLVQWVGAMHAYDDDLTVSQVSLFSLNFFQLSLDCWLGLISFLSLDLDCQHCRTPSQHRLTHGPTVGRQHPRTARAGPDLVLRRPFLWRLTRVTAFR